MNGRCRCLQWRESSLAGSDPKYLCRPLQGVHDSSASARILARNCARSAALVGEWALARSSVREDEAQSDHDPASIWIAHDNPVLFAALAFGLRQLRAETVGPLLRWLGDCAQAHAGEV